MTANLQAAGFEHPPEAIEAALELLARRTCAWVRAAQPPSDDGAVIFLRCGLQPGHEGKHSPNADDACTIRGVLRACMAERLRGDFANWRDQTAAGRDLIAHRLAWWQWRILTGEVTL